MIDWYRRKTWTNRDEEEFFAKLKRARVGGRAQYLRVQAIELVETKQKELLAVAESLLNTILTEYPEARIEKSPALNALGEIYKLRNDYEKALDYYSRSLDFEKVFPNVITSSYLDFAELIIKTSRKDLYETAETLLEKKLKNELLPVTKYKMCAILSIINRGKGNLDKAEHYHDLAEQNANVQTSGLRYHKHLGIVLKRDSWLDRMMGGNTSNS